jgi:hypothetical protein
MKTHILVALGCAFWSLPLAWLVTLTFVHGTPENGYGFHYEGSDFSYDLLLLLAIPLLMLALTAFLGWLEGRGRLTEVMTATSSVLAVLAAVSWCATLFLIQTA